MKLRGIDYGCVIGASGVQGFFGEGYPFHRLFKRAFPKGFSFDGMTFTAKTMTLGPRKGNMPLGPDGITPIERRPKCIHVSARSWLKGAALNAVGLSNPGMDFLLSRHVWQERTDAFFLSFMSVEQDRAARLRELEMFVRALKPRLQRFKGKPALQINFSCPNVGVHSDELIYEILEGLDIAEPLGIPLVPKVNLLTRPSELARVDRHTACDAICVSNTLSWDSLPVVGIDRKALFGSDVSPLAEFKGGGGLSGAALFPLLGGWLMQARGLLQCPIIAGGGILSPIDIVNLRRLGMNLVPSLGSIAFLRPWRVAACIRMAHDMFSADLP